MAGICTVVHRILIKQACNCSASSASHSAAPGCTCYLDCFCCNMPLCCSFSASMRQWQSIRLFTDRVAFVLVHFKHSSADYQRILCSSQLPHNCGNLTLHCDMFQGKAVLPKVWKRPLLKLPRLKMPLLSMLAGMLLLQMPLVTMLLLEAVLLSMHPVRRHLQHRSPRTVLWLWPCKKRMHAKSQTLSVTLSCMAAASSVFVHLHTCSLTCANAQALQNCFCLLLH